MISASFYIPDLTYKARTLTVHIRRPRAHPAYQARACVVFHNRMSLGGNFTGFVWGTCLNGSHCKCICHPLFCLGFWRCPKISLLIALNVVLTREEACTKMHYIALLFLECLIINLILYSCLPSRFTSEPMYVQPRYLNKKNPSELHYLFNVGL